MVEVVDAHDAGRLRWLLKAEADCFANGMKRAQHAWPGAEANEDSWRNGDMRVLQLSAPCSLNLLSKKSLLSCLLAEACLRPLILVKHALTLC